MAVKPDPARRIWRRLKKEFRDACWYIAYPANMLGPVLPPDFTHPTVAADPGGDPDALLPHHPDERIR